MSSSGSPSRAKRIVSNISSVLDSYSRPKPLIQRAETSDTSSKRTSGDSWRRVATAETESSEAPVLLNPMEANVSTYSVDNVSENFHTQTRVEMEEQSMDDESMSEKDEILMDTLEVIWEFNEVKKTR